MPDGGYQKEQLVMDDRGGVTVFSLVTVLLVFLLGTTYLSLAQGDLRMTTRQVQSRQAMYLAEAGIELARCELALNPNWTPDQAYGLETGSYTVALSKVAPGYLVDCTGRAGEAYKKIRVNLQPDGSGGFKIVSYTEVFN